MRARYPDGDGYIERNGARLYYEVYENEGPTILLAPTWQTAYSRSWKMQIPYLARHFRVVTYDPVGNGKSDRSLVPERYMMSERVADAIAVLDTTETSTCVAAGLSAGGFFVLTIAAVHPERVDGVISIAPPHPESVPTPGLQYAWEHMLDEVSEPVGWEKYNVDHWRNDWADFVEFFFEECANDPHSTKLYDDLVRWAMETSGEVIALTSTPPPSYDFEWLTERIRSISCPSLVIQGSDDRLFDVSNGEVLAKALNADFAVLEGAGHVPIGRHPVKVNHLIKDFIDRTCGTHRPQPSWHIGSGRSKKALYISSPIGLGHAMRDVAIADELRKIHPDLEVEWLAQDPVTRVLDANDETIHPASRYLANESAHLESESGEHELNAFQAIRNMDEIMTSNFMLLDEVVTEGQYDLVIGDETWELDYHLHENPNLKKTSYAWMTDFVGWVPMPSGGEREAFVAADYNAEMIEHIARYPRIRDKAIFVGNPEDIIPGTFGPDLPAIRDWTVANYDFAGYVTGFDPDDLGDRDQLRAQLGYHPDERVCIVTVGGSGVGRSLINRIVEGYPACRKAVSDLRMIVVSGPRLDPDSLPQVDGVEYRRHVDGLYRHLAVCDLAIVQGGLTTTMELTAAKVPFLYVPLRNHFEQSFHVPSRLERYGAGQRMEYEEIDPESLADAVGENLGRKVDYLDVETDGAARAASLIAELI